LEEEKMRKFVLILAVVALVSAPAFATWPFWGVPILGQPQNNWWRPTCDADAVLGGVPQPVINWSTWSGNVGGRFAVIPKTQAAVAAPSAYISWAGWAMQTGISNEWAVYGGPPLGSNAGINVENLVTGAIINIPEVQSAGNYGFTDVNAYGDVVWVGWPEPTDPVDQTSARIRYANVGAPGVITTLAYTGNQGEGGQRMRLSSDSDRLAFRDAQNSGSGGLSASLYDLGTIGPTPAGRYSTFTSDGDQRYYKSAIDDSGNWLVSNIRSVADNTSKSDVVLINLNAAIVPFPGPAVVGAGQTYLTGDGSGGLAPTHTRNDPSMDLINADTAIVVWGDNASGNYNIKGMFVTGLAAGVPVPGKDFYITTGTRNRNNPDVDYCAANGQILVTWLAEGSPLQIEYTWIPEPASLSLLVLGGLALIRRR
jgi:hypothetical protein